jgi:DNA mismatch endonuclease, patch repair protein
MSRIRRHDTKPTDILRRLLYARGHRYRKEHYIREARTHPDIVFPTRKLAIYVDGCFWHGCTRCSKRPRSNTGYWNGKLKRNVERDARQRAVLESAGWTVLRFWEHEVTEKPEHVVQRIEEVLHGA